jgi:thiol-disulfide isomerase/thioredoxin
VLCLLVALPAQAQRAFPEAKLIAVYFYADWCPNCPQVSKELDLVKKEMAGGDVLFVTLNLTDRAAIHQSMMLAKQLGIDDFVRAQGSATGYVSVIRASDQLELARFTRDHSAAVIAERLPQLQR